MLEIVYADLMDTTAIAQSLDGVDIVFHLAAEKHVDRAEREPSLAVRSNVLGTLALISAARSAGVKRLIAASTDKAAEPTAVMAATKFLMERVLCESDRPGCISVRLGGLLNSSGAVLERWRGTARENGRIEVTDPEMTRFVMTIDEAIEAFQDAEDHDGHAIIAPALSAYRLGDLAEAFVTVHAARIVVVGARVGDKMHETLVSVAEAPFTRHEQGRFVITPGRLQSGCRPYTSRDAPRLTVPQLKRRILAESRPSA
jgi:FlaA1/EpsC-like NDP-sugar epimerase